MPKTAAPAADVLVVSLYQPQCQELGCDWEGIIHSDLGDACQQAESHEAAHALKAANYD